MNREIKFRAWVPSVKVMLTQISIHPDGDIGLHIDHLSNHVSTEKFLHDTGEGFYSRAEDSDDEEMVLNYLYCDNDWIQLEARDVRIMQYTGLKDKNGVEIYKGDILCRSTNEVGVAAWSALFGCWDFQPLNKELRNNVALFQVRSDARVIGNIHEHPELLK